MDSFAEDSSDDEKKVMKLSWRRMQNLHITDGFREGAIAGKDKQFQTSFDDGYTSGFLKSYKEGYKSGEERIRLFLLKKDRGSCIMQTFQRSLDNLCVTCSRLPTNV